MAQSFQKQDTKATTQIQSDHQASPDGGPAGSECHRGMMKCGLRHHGLKGVLLMVACCAIPLVLLLALPALGAAVGGFATSAITILAILVCPVGMVVMMWMMTREKDIDAS